MFREWQICKGCFEPRSSKFGKSFHIDRMGVKIVPSISDYIKKQKGRIVVINDGELETASFENAKKQIKDAFERILPQKSSFEM